MSSFFSRSLKVFATGVACLALIGAVFASTGEPLSPEVKDQVLASIHRILENEAFVPNVDFSKWDTYLSKDKKEIANAKTDDEFAAAVQSAAAKFGVSHIYLMTPTEARARIDHSMVGIGISFAEQKDGILITRVFKGSASETAGLLPGDLIEMVDGSKKDLLSRLRGKKDTKVKIKVKHPAGAEQTLTLTREPFDITIPITLEKVDADTSLLTIPTFDVTYDADKVQTLLEKARDVPNLIIDLRSNPGGALLNMLQFLSMTLKPETAIGEIITPAEIKEYQKAHAGPIDVVTVAKGIPASNRLVVSSVPGHPPYKGHIAVLINEASGSAAEIAAQAFKETRNATIIGEKSAGAVLVSVIYQISHGFMLECPKYDYVSIDGVRLEGHGVIPDVHAKTPTVPSIANDPAIKAALQAFNNKDKEQAKGQTIRV